MIFVRKILYFLEACAKIPSDAEEGRLLAGFVEI